ncbi:Pr6Pr family membrane protein [Bradyrhizobium prioriisuperbiae]|uniref:Pr6Pr family membrane protein n=1 Tax=Bradyrhizobium prioriisuperbiae TaxID=2854389 RepID=UPI0028E99313|nr:Pr6Pr family membrane protein [Bradyrhizobium prioritasuperba]
MIDTIRSAKTKRLAIAALAVVGWVALMLRYLILVTVVSPELVSPEVLVRYVSFFAVQVNFLAALVLTAFAFKAGRDEWLVHPFVRSAIAVYAAAVLAIYLPALPALLALSGVQFWADLLLRYLMPSGYLLFWLFLVRKAGLRWYDPLLWLIYPLFYLAFVVIRGKMSGFYPYPFIDVGALGYSRALLNAGGIMVICVGLGALAVLIGRLSAK